MLDQSQMRGRRYFAHEATRAGSCADTVRLRRFDGFITPRPLHPYNLATQSSPATSSVTSFDGTYRNTIRVTGSTTLAKGTSWCETPGQPIITVAEGHFNYAVSHPNVPGNAIAIFQATIAQDGSFFGQVVAGSISGSVNGAHMEGRIDGTGCQYAFSGDRV